jgi:DNA-binding MarR family transcriptional regulator
MLEMREKAQLIARECGGYSVRRAARVVATIYNQAIDPSGLSSTQFSLLNAIYLMQPVGINQLAESMLTDRTTLTRNLARMSNNRLVKEVNEQDRRRHVVSLTSEGESSLRQAQELWSIAQQKVENQLGTARIKRLRSDLKLLESLATDPTE